MNTTVMVKDMMSERESPIREAVSRLLYFEEIFHVK
jgi:hypothetical protein